VAPTKFKKGSRMKTNPSYVTIDSFPHPLGSKKENLEEVTEAVRHLDFEVSVSDDTGYYTVYFNPCLSRDDTIKRIIEVEEALKSKSFKLR